MYQQIRVFNRFPAVHQLGQLRFVAQAKTIEGPPTHSVEWEKAKPTSEIPGPTKWELIRGFLPGGEFYKKSFIDFSLIARKKYGDLYMMPGVFGNDNILITFNPDDFPIALRSEGVWPRRRGLQTMTYHRTVHRKEFFGDVIGLLGSNGEAWGRLRTAVNPVLMQPRNARLYLNKMLEVNDEFLQRIREIRDPKTLEMPDTFEDEINRLTFESVAAVALNQPLGLIRKNRDAPEAKQIFSSLKTVFELTLELDVKPSLWKLFNTPDFKKVMKAYDDLCDIIIKHINQAMEKIESKTMQKNENEEESVLEKLLKIDKKVAIVMALDMLMAGVDTTSTTLVGIMLCIAKNPEKQEKLRQELRAILPEKDSKLTLDNMKNLPYLRACIKEGIRIYPIGSGTFRSNGEDVVLSGYRVPKNHDLVVNSNLLLMEEKHFPRATEFIPERWLRTEKDDQPHINPFLYTPFGFGPRSCVGMRLVQLEMEITVARLVRNFYVEFNYPIENAFKNLLINVPAIPLNFKMSEVEN